MNAKIRQYIFGALFFGVGIWELFNKDYLEASLYCLAGLAFTFNTLTTEPRLAPYKKVLVITTWSLILITGVLFLFLMQYKYF
jgi:hypothetical protein